MKFSDFKQTLLEGVYDPGIFKAFFLAGGAGSGKSYSAEKATGSAAGKFEWTKDYGKGINPAKTGPYGLKVVNSDEQLEYGLMQKQWKRKELEGSQKRKLRREKPCGFKVD